MFKFEWKGGIKMSKFKDNLGIDQSVTGELIKMLKFEWNMGNRTILVQNVKSIRMLKFGCKGEFIKVLKLRLNFGINQNVEVWVHIQ